LARCAGDAVTVAQNWRAAPPRTATIPAIHAWLITEPPPASAPVMEEVKREARRRKIELLIVPTDEAIKALGKDSLDTNALLHVTC